MDIQDEIDRSFGPGPEPGPVDALVADGRRALRRRRATTAAAALAIVLVDPWELPDDVGTVVADARAAVDAVIAQVG